MQGLSHKDILLVLREILLLEERHRHKQTMAAQRVRALTEFCTRFTWQQKRKVICLEWLWGGAERVIIKVVF